MNKFLFRPILTASTITFFSTLFYGLYNASLPGGAGGMIGAVSFSVAILAGLIMVIEHFIVKNTAATNKRLLITESIVLIGILATIRYLLQL